MSTTKRRRAANGQRVDRYGANGWVWYWECDHHHQPETQWWDRAPDQDEAYAALDRHNTMEHPELTEEARRG